MGSSSAAVKDKTAAHNDRKRHAGRSNFIRLAQLNRTSAGLPSGFEPSARGARGARPSGRFVVPCSRASKIFAERLGSPTLMRRKRRAPAFLFESNNLQPAKKASIQSAGDRPRCDGPAVPEAFPEAGRVQVFRFTISANVLDSRSLGAG